MADYSRHDRLDGKEKATKTVNHPKNVIILRINHDSAVPPLLCRRNRRVRQQGVHLELPYNAVNATGIHRSRGLGILWS